MTDPFAGYDPNDDEREKLPVIQLSTVGDTFKGTVTRIGSEFETDYGTKYPVELNLSFVAIKPLPEIEDLQKEYTPPAVGTDAVFFVTATKQDGKRHHVQEEIEKAAKRASSTGLNEGDTLAGKLVDKVKNKKNPTYKPFKKHAFLIEPATLSDPFTGEAPF
jgi:hypothetical protein